MTLYVQSPATPAKLVRKHVDGPYVIYRGRIRWLGWMERIKLFFGILPNDVAEPVVKTETYFLPDHMKPWPGGPIGPADWNGEACYRRDNSVYVPTGREDRCWNDDGDPCNIVGYPFVELPKLRLVASR